MYNCSIGNAPTYLTELLTEKQVVRSDLRSTAQESFILYDVPFNKNSTFSDRGFMTAAPKLWNGLPSIVKRSMSLDVFKKIHHVLIIVFYQSNLHFMVTYVTK